MDWGKGAEGTWRRRGGRNEAERGKTGAGISRNRAAGKIKGQQTLSNVGQRILN